MSDKTQRSYIRHIETFVRFLGRSAIPQAATTSGASSSHRSSRGAATENEYAGLGAALP
jgi:hypothetical protein